jgi:hypothetical protein
MFRTILFLFFILLTSCVETVSTEVLQNAPEASLVVPEKIMSPEARALENKVANRTLLQTVVDGSVDFKRTEFSYACNNVSGGVLTFIKDEKETKGIRFAVSEEGWNEFVSLYYRGNELALAVHEKGTWQGIEETTIQTIFYLDDGAVLRCMQKKVQGEIARMEALIQAAEFVIIHSDEPTLDKLKEYEHLFTTEITKKNIAAHFCH